MNTLKVNSDVASETATDDIWLKFQSIPGTEPSASHNLRLVDAKTGRWVRGFCGGTIRVVKDDLIRASIDVELWGGIEFDALVDDYSINLSLGTLAMADQLEKIASQIRARAKQETDSAVDEGVTK